MQEGTNNGCKHCLYYSFYVEKEKLIEGDISVQGAQQKSELFVSTVWINLNTVEQETGSNVASNKDVP